MTRPWFILWLALGFLSLSGCDQQETESVEKPQGKPLLQSVAENRPVAVEAIGQDNAILAKPDPAPEPEVIAEMDPAPDSVAAPIAAVDGFTVEKFAFKFHRETQAEVCGDWDHFIYNGSMTIIGHIQSKTPVDMTAADFELELTTPFSSYTLPAQRERETLSGQDRIEQVIVRKGQQAIFYVKDYRVDDDEVVYLNDDDETGVLNNFGPLMDAVFDWKNQRWVLSVTRAELMAEDIEPGEVFEISLWMPRFSPEKEDFDQTGEFRYTGEAMDSDDYDYDGDCP